MNNFAWNFQGGKLNQSVISVTLVNNTAKTIDITVPAGKRWMFLGLKITNPDNVARNINVHLYKEAGKTNLIKRILVQTGVAASGERYYPNSVTATLTVMSFYVPTFLEGGNTIESVWAAGGASAGGTDADGLVIEYLEIDA